MLIDCKINVRIWESEGAMGKNGEMVVPKNYLMELFESQNFTMKFLSPKPYNEYGILHNNTRKAEWLTAHLD